MSLINDALKRAKEAQQKHARPPAGTTMRPAEAARPIHPPRSLLLPLVGAAVLVLVGGVLIVVAVSRGLRPEAVPNPQPVLVNHDAATASSFPSPSAVVPQPVNDPGANPVPPSVSVPQPVQTTSATPTTTATAVTQAVAAVETPAPVPVVPVVPEPPLPKLQGILFTPPRSTAFLNGKSVAVGARAGEFTVLTITKEAVTVERAGQTYVLTMEE